MWAVGSTSGDGTFRVWRPEADRRSARRSSRRDGYGCRSVTLTIGATAGMLVPSSSTRCLLQRRPGTLGRSALDLAHGRLL